MHCAERTLGSTAFDAFRLVFSFRLSWHPISTAVLLLSRALEVDSHPEMRVANLTYENTSQDPRDMVDSNVIRVEGSLKGLLMLPSRTFDPVVHHDNRS